VARARARARARAWFELQQTGQYSRSGRFMYSTSVMPERCVRVAWGEQ
jgi:hypothetical protein